VTAVQIVLIGVAVMWVGGIFLAARLAKAARVGDEIAEGWDNGLEWWKEQQ